MNKFYVTYGFGSNLSGCYSEVEGEDYSEARATVDEATGGKFAFMYDETQYASAILRWNLKKVPLQAQVKRSLLEDD